VYIRSLSYLACKAHAPYYIVICGLSGPPILVLIWTDVDGTTFGRKALNMKRVFRFFLRLLSEIFPILRTIQRDIIVNVRRYSCKLPVILSDLDVT
jgi:hypothetical protein